MYVKCFARSVNCDTAYQWMDAAEVITSPEKLEELMASWDMLLARVNGELLLQATMYHYRQRP